MEKILPIASATGAHSFAPTEASPPPLIDHDQDSDHATSLPPHNSDKMDVDHALISATSSAIASADTIFSTNSMSSADTSFPADTFSADNIQPPATKRQRLGGNDGVLRSRSSPALAVPSEKSRNSGKGKGKVKTSSDRSESSAHSASFRALSTTQRVNKVTPAAALVELHGSVTGMTKAIIAASKPPESTEDKAVARCQEAVRLVQERDDGLSILEKASLIVFFGKHNTEADMYIALEDAQLRQEVIKHWIQGL
jgi:hypothetical protein